MQKLSLGGAWVLDIPGSAFPRVPAQVPGSVYHDLLTAGEIPDPFYRDNENEALKLMENDFVYSRSFTVPASLLENDAVVLHCDGLDTLATVTVNGCLVGTAKNMHRTYEFDVKPALKAGENEITVKFGSPTRFIREAYALSRADGSTDAMVGFPLIRKAHCMFGWDWGPRLPDAGIWRDISILGVRTARIRDVHVLQFHEEGKVTLEINTHVTELTGSADVKVSVTAPDGTVFTAEGEKAVMEIENPALWWPNGLGSITSSTNKFKEYLNTLTFIYIDDEPVIDYLILTHPDSDHIGNAEYVFENYLVKNCYLPQIYTSEAECTQETNVYCESQLYSNVIDALENEVTNYGCNKIYTCEGLSITSQVYNATEATTNNQMWILDFFAPIVGSVYKKSASSKVAVTNDYSPIMILNYMDRKIMFTGDASDDVEKEFVSKVLNNDYSYSIEYFDIDVLKIGHHGSASSTCEEFLDIIKPEFAIASVGQNSYGHPSSETITRLEESGVNSYNIYRTDRNGNIAMGVSLTGEIALESDHIQYTRVEFKLWQIILIAVGITAIIIYSPYTVKVVKYKKIKKGKSEK